MVLVYGYTFELQGTDKVHQDKVDFIMKDGKLRSFNIDVIDNYRHVDKFNLLERRILGAAVVGGGLAVSALTDMQEESPPLVNPNKNEPCIDALRKG